MLNGKTVVVTGASRGIGKAIALRFAGEGANIVISYRGNEPDGLVAELGKKNRVIAVKADVSSYTDAENLIKAAKDEFGSIDCLINNAGITRDNLLLRMSEDDFDEVYKTNLKGAFNTIKHVTPVMLKQRSGSIINISSVVGVTGNAGQANYAASKAGLIGLTKSTAKELGSRGIRCNAIAPGFIETDMTAKLPEQVKEKMLAGIPLGRFGTPEDVAELCVFLAGCEYITGQVLHCDGGMVM